MRTRARDFANTTRNWRFLRTNGRTNGSFLVYKDSSLQKDISHVSDFNTPRSIFSLRFFFFFDYARAIVAYYIFAQNPILKRGAHAPFSQIGHFLPVLRHFFTRTYSESSFIFQFLVLFYVKIVFCIPKNSPKYH